MFRFLQLVAVLAAVLAPLAVPGAALAHERREVGPYTFVVGWEGEPAFSGQKNGASLRITRTDNGEAVEGAEKTLKLEVIQGGARREFPLRAVFRTPGSYTADVVPTKDGDYRFRFFGTVGSTNVEQTFDSAEGKFNKVQPIQEIHFPATASEPSPTAATGEPPAPLSSLVSARSAINVALTFGVIGSVIGGLALLLGVLALVSSARRSKVGQPLPEALEGRPEEARR